MPDNPLSTALGQVSALLNDFRERGEAATEQAQTKIAESIESAQERITESREDLTERVAERVDSAQSTLDETLANALATFEEAKSKLAALPVELPAEIEELRARFSPEELRKVADAYLAVAAALLASLSERTEEVVDRLKAQPLVGENLPKLEKSTTTPSPSPKTHWEPWRRRPN